MVRKRTKMIRRLSRHWNRLELPRKTLQKRYFEKTKDSSETPNNNSILSSSKKHPQRTMITQKEATVEARRLMG